MITAKEFDFLKARELFDQLCQFVQQAADAANQFDVRDLAITAHVIDMTHLTAIQDGHDRVGADLAVGELAARRHVLDDAVLALALRDVALPTAGGGLGTARSGRDGGPTRSDSAVDGNE